MFVLRISDFDYTRYNLVYLRTQEECDDFQSQLDVVLQKRPSSFKIAPNIVFTKTGSNKYELKVEGTVVTISDIDDFFFEELPEAQDFVISLT
jgi:hypothetical protein